ncbi:hypothetical protein VKS41_003770 [Umbelopsis sp. WA50703]
MDLSKLEVAIHIHSTDTGSKNAPRLVSQKRTVDNLYSVRVENMEEIDPYYDSRYEFTACLKTEENDMSSIKQQIDLNVQSALDGFNSALLIMSAGVKDKQLDRSKIISYAINSLKSQMHHLDEYRAKKSDEKLNIEYAYLGITDDCCFDLRNDRRIKNDIILEDGIDTLMKPAANVDQIWEKVKLGSKFPFVLKVRLSDNTRFLGNFVIADLLTTRFVAASTRIKDGYAFNESCSRLRETVRLIATPNHIGLIPADACVLTKVLAEYLCGMSRMNAFIHVEECPETALEETLSALDFAQHLQRIICRSLRNTVDMRLADTGSKAEYYKDRFYRAQASVNKMETRCGELQLELEQSKAALENTSNTETEIKYDLEHSAITNAELRSKNRNLQLEIEYLKHHVEVFKTDFEEQIRQLQTEAGMLKHSQRRAICEAEDLEEELKEKESKAQQVEDLELFQKQAKLLLNESDNRYAKMVRFYERKEGDFLEQMQQEKSKWSEKRSIMQSKIDNLQHELERSRDQSFKVQQEKLNWRSNQERLQAQLTRLVRRVDIEIIPQEEAKAVTTHSNMEAGNDMNTAVTIQDISNLRSELERQAKELEGYKAQIYPVEHTVESESARGQHETARASLSRPDISMQYESSEPENIQSVITNPVNAIGTDGANIVSYTNEPPIAKENVQPVIGNQQARSIQSTTNVTKGKEKASKPSSKQSKTSSSQTIYNSTESQPNALTSTAYTTSKATNDTAPPNTISQIELTGKVNESTTNAIQDNNKQARALSPELLVSPNVRQSEPVPNPLASAREKFTKPKKPAKTPLQTENVAKLPRKKRKLGSRKTITAEEHNVSQLAN